MKLGSVMCREGEVAKREGSNPTLNKLRNSHHISKRLRHFFFGLQEITMHPDRGQRSAVRRLALSDFVGVMSSNMGHASGMNIKWLAE